MEVGYTAGADTRRLEKQPLNHHGKFIGKAEIIEDLKLFQYAEGISLPKKNIRYYMSKVYGTILFPKKRSKLLKRFQ